MESNTLSKKYNYVYLITNLVNGKQYVGKHSTDILEDGYMGSGKLIQKAELKYGIENFSKEYLAFCDKADKLNWFEQYYIKKFKTFGEGYNLTAGGEGQLGFVPSEETRLKISDIHKGKKKTDEHKRKISEALKGNTNTLGMTCSEDTKRKIGLANKGHHHTEEVKQRISEKKKIKYKWIDIKGDIHLMDISNAKRYHPDWKLYE